MVREICAVVVLLNKLFMFILLFTLARELGIELYGVFSYHYAIITGIATVVGESLSVALSRHVILEPEKVSFNTLLNVLVWGGAGAGALCVVVPYLFPAPASPHDISLSYITLGAFLLGFACVSNLAITGMMYAVNSSIRWAIALASHGMFGMLLVISVAKLDGRVESVLLVLALCTFIAPVFGILIIKANEAGASPLGREFFSFGKVWALLSSSGTPAIAASMLLGAPVHIMCLMIFGNSSASAAEVGLFNIFFLFYILVTVLPSSLASYAIVRLAGQGGRGSKLYLLLGSVVSVCLPLLMIVSQDYWLCFLGESICGRNELLKSAAIAGGLGLITAILTQIMHSERLSKVVFLASLIYALVYLASTIFLALQGGMLALDLFKSFIFALVAQLVVLVLVMLRVRRSCQ